MSPPVAPGVLLPGFEGPLLPDWLAARLDAGLAGVCLFGSNVESPRQLRRLTDAIVAHNPRALIAIDEEGGDVTRLYYDRGAPTLGNAWLGRYDDLDVTREVARGIAEQLADVGVNLNLAPDVDINSNDANPVIGVRSFGADPERVAAHGAAWVAGHQSIGVAACAKHFPGHGDTDLDSHLELPTVDQSIGSLRRRELVPFEAVVDSGVWAVMTSHILLPRLDPDQPATFSAAILSDLLRAELGFDGVVISDALDMAGASAQIGIPDAAVRAIRGGCDLLCIGTDNSAEQLDEIEQRLTEAADADVELAAALNTAADRVATLAARLARSRRTVGDLPDAFSESDGDLALPAEAAFDVGPRARRLLAADVNQGRWTVVILDSAANNAAGIAPWGVHAGRDRAGDLVPISIDASVGPEFAASLSVDVPIVVVGRDNHRHAWARTFIDDLRARRSDVLVIDMGWPDSSRTFADIATFGASRRMGQAVLDLLAGRTAIAQVRS